MQKKIRFLLFLASTAIVGVIGVQSLLVSKYYGITLQRFEREIDLTFEKAIKKEFALRNDSLEELLYRFVMDSTNIRIHSKWNAYGKMYVYTFTSQGDNTPNQTGFSTSAFNKPILYQGDSTRSTIARLYARRYRERDLDNNMVHYDRQNIGKLISKSLNDYEFDTSNLKKIYKGLLSKEGIFDPFYFVLRPDATTKQIIEGEKRKNKWVTKAFPTYDISFKYATISAVFPSATTYLFGHLVLIVSSSAVLLIIVGSALLYMIRLLSRAKAASTIKNDFINNITHELKTPIATISTALEAFEHFEAFNDKNKREKYLRTSREQVVRLSDLVNKILHISIYERQEFDMKKEPVHIDNLIRDLIKNFSLLYNEKVRFSYHNSFPDTHIIGDKTALYSAISNLFDNAIKYSKEAPLIKVDVFRKEGYCIMQVADNGAGINRADLVKIFDKFYRIPTKSHEVKGYGLGLFYVKHIVEKHKGWYSVKSNPGIGSEFKIAIPDA